MSIVSKTNKAIAQIRINLGDNLNFVHFDPATSTVIINCKKPLLHRHLEWLTEMLEHRQFERVK